MAYDALEPLDTARRIELATGTVAAMVHNANTTGEAKAPSDFVIQWDKPPEPVEDAAAAAWRQEVLEARMDGLMRRHGIGWEGD